MSHTKSSNIIKEAALTSFEKDGHGEAKRLYIETASYETFKRFVASYVKEVSCMMYKLV